MRYLTSGPNTRGGRPSPTSAHTSILRSPLARTLGAVILATLLTTACGGGGAPDQTPPPAVSPVSADVVPDLPLADKLYAEGEADEAIKIYSAAALRGDADQKQQAIWSLARIQYQTGDFTAATQNLQAFIATKLSPEQQRRAYLLLGFVRLAQGDRDGAKDAFETYLDSAGPAAPYAHLRLAEIASQEGDSGQAIEQTNLALTASLPAPAKTDAMFALARYQEADGDAASAAATDQTLAADAPTASDVAEALWQLSQLSRRSGDAQTYQDSLHSLIVEYPSHSRALQALDEPQLAAVPATTPRERALVLFRHRVNDKAQDAYRALLADPRAQGEAHYYLGILAERAGDPGQALNEYAAAIGALAGTADPLLGSAHWDRGLVFESVGRLEEAAAEYAAIADAVPGSEHVADGLFRAGLIRFRQGRPSDSAALWSEYLVTAPSAASRAQAHFWLAQADRALGDEASAELEMDAASSAAPLDYYGLRARALATGDGAPADPGSLSPKPPDWAALEAWLAASFGAEDAKARDAFFAGDGWQRAQELSLSGLKQEAGVEFNALIEQAVGQPWRLYRLARALSESGQARLAARAASALASGTADLPPDLLRLAYPAPFLSAINEAASGAGLSPLLLLALVRQESFYDPAAASSAGALGLTQVIPSTAQEIAVQLDETGFRETDLLRPTVSLRFGAHYLKSQLDLFQGNLAAALAAYNGGAGNASRWQTAAGGDADAFLEVIDFAETRTYVSVVLENYALYRYAYGVTDHASLPLP